MSTTDTADSTLERTGFIIPLWLEEKLKQENTAICPESQSSADKIDIQVKNFNDTMGDLTDYDCPKCKNRGETAVNRNGYFATITCDCKVMRRNMEQIRESGLSDLLDIYIFENYKTTQDWQQSVKSRAAGYASERTGDWLCVLGCVGSGKTHICTAVCGELMKKGRALKYMLWRDESVKIKAIVNDRDEYSRLITPFKEAEILYIDDLLKTKKDAPISAGDINLAFELINYRYNQPNKKTIISSEKSLDELLEIDMAIGSRIYERCKTHAYCLEITQTGENNFRLK